MVDAVGSAKESPYDRLSLGLNLIEPRNSQDAQKMRYDPAG